MKSVSRFNLSSAARIGVGSTADRPSRLFWHKHFQRILVVASEHFPLEYLEMLPVDVVLMLAPRWPSLFVLKTPVNREEWRQHLKLIAGHEHFVDLSVPRVAVADETLVMLRIVVRRNEERLVEELKVGDRVTYLHLVCLRQIGLPSVWERESLVSLRTLRPNCILSDLLCC